MNADGSRLLLELPAPEVVLNSDRPGDALRKLFEDLARGDLDALAGIYDCSAPEIYALALWRTSRSSDAEDVVQEVLVRLAERRAGLRAVRSPRTYLLAMAHSAAVDRMRSRRRLEPVEDRLLQDADAPDPDRRLDARRASRLLLTLPARQREAIYLHHFAELTFREIGRVTGVPTFTAASRYRLGMRRLRKIMGGER